MEKDIMTFPFELKESDDATGMFVGYASTFGGSKDSKGDVVNNGAFTKSLNQGGRNGTGVAMLWQHDPHSIPGVWKELVEDDKGLKAVGQLAMGTQLGKDAYELIKLGAIKGLSVGYNTVDYEVDEKSRIRYLKEVDLWEISLVTFPANIRATVTGIKAIEEAKTPRELETVLREAGLSREAAKYMVKLAKSSLCEVENDNKQYELHSILTMLNKMNNELSGIERI